MSSRTVKIDLKDFGKTIKQYANNIAAQTAIDIKDDLSNYAYETMLEFYADYTPKVYKRGKRNFIGVISSNGTRAFRGYYKNRGDRFEGGLLFTQEVMFDDYHASTEQVLNSVLEGWHGPAYPTDDENEAIFSGRKSRQMFRPAERMTPSPMELLEDRLDYYEDNLEKFLRNAERKVKLNV